ncbi:hypothetical protein M2138_000762 [Dysgonomonadaceae bacterium PH5-43]|nr:hypothetical protein [Dysgonomonadaceae bacterium PH5-43]
MQSIHKQILTTINGFVRGKIFFPEQFDHLGSNESIRQSLSRICKDEIILRLSKGVYLYPVIDSELGILYPSVDTVAKAIAARDKARIIPTGAYALNRLGLSTQVPMNVVYLTDGIPRKVKIDRQTITFKQTAPKNFSFKGEIAPLVVSALKEIGRNEVTDKDLEQVNKVLKMESKEIIISDAYIAPRWIKDIILSLINKSENE